MTTFALSQKQAYALFSPATEILYGGAANSGKSHLARITAITFARAVPGIVIRLFRRTYPQLWANHMEGPTSFPAMLGPDLDGGRVTWNKSRHIFSFANGSLVMLGHCQNETDMTNVQGPEYQILIIDELTHWTEKMYRWFRSRLRLGSLVVPPKLRDKIPFVLACTNPGSIGHDWVKACFIDPMQGGDAIWRTGQKDGGMLRQFVKAIIDDNKFATEEDRARLESIGGDGMAEAMRWGNWDAPPGRRFGRTWNPAKSVIPGFRVPRDWPVDRSFDWGYSRPYSTGFWAVSTGSPVILSSGEEARFAPGSLIRIGELYGAVDDPRRRNTGLCHSPQEISRSILEYEGYLRRNTLSGQHIRPGPADNSIWDSDRGASTASQMARSGVHWTRANKAPGSRILRWRRCDQLMSAREDQPGLYVFEECENFIRTVPLVPASPKNMEDVDSDSEDHIADEFGYRVLAMPDDFRSPRHREIKVRA